MCCSETFEMTPTVLTACSPAGHEQLSWHAWRVMAASVVDMALWRSKTVIHQSLPLDASGCSRCGWVAGFFEQKSRAI